MGDDVIFGDYGADTLWGGDGADTFVYTYRIDRRITAYYDLLQDFDNDEDSIHDQRAPSGSPWHAQCSGT